MRKVALALMLCLGLTACGTTNPVGLWNTVTASTQNPVTKSVLYKFENGMIIAFAGLNAYKRSCVRGAIPASCKGVISNLQIYTRKIPGQLTLVRAFVKNNDQVNAIVAFNTAKAMLAEFKSIATANNIKVQ